MQRVGHYTLYKILAVEKEPIFTRDALVAIIT
jgi:hypothetical protein